MNPAFVLDCSVIMAWLFADERDAYSVAVSERLRHESAIVPPLCHLEAANALLVAERRKRITRADSARSLEYLRALPIHTDKEQTAERADILLDLARRHGLEAYDAVYLDLAIRMGLPIATLDLSLRRAAKSAGVAVLKRS